MCLLEHFKDRSQIHQIALKLGFPAENCEGNEKIWLFWSAAIHPNFVQITPQVITFNMNIPEVDKAVNCSCVYANCLSTERERERGIMTYSGGLS